MRILFKIFPWGALVFFSAQANAQWSQVAPGLDYAQFTAPGPNNVFVARMKQDEPTLIIDAILGNGKLYGTASESKRETVSGMVARYNDTILYWPNTYGPRREILAAINGDFFNLSSGVPPGGQIIGGAYAKRHPHMGGHTGFIWKFNREFFVGGCVAHRSEKQIITLPSGDTVEFNGLNEVRGDDSLIVYNDYYDSVTHTDNSGVEVLVDLGSPFKILPAPGGVKGRVEAIYQNQGNTPIPFDHVVLSAKGSEAASLTSLAVGNEIKISQEITNYNLPPEGCATAWPLDWTKAFANTTGNFEFIIDGKIIPTDNAGLNEPTDPRTAIAYNSEYIYFVVVDGRGSGGSRGMTTDELGTFCIDTLAATHAVNQDGGGSSALWVNGSIKNDPSDGSERTVANGWIIARVVPTDKSNKFLPTDIVETTDNAPLHLGPGDNFAAPSSINAGTQGEILNHSATGAKARGSYWWKCQFGSQEGWVQEDKLRLVQRQEPQPQETQPEEAPGPDEPGLHEDAGSNDVRDEVIADSSEEAELRGSCGCENSTGSNSAASFTLLLTVVGLAFYGLRRALSSPR